MTTWQVQVPGCFGSVDKIFANHPNDQARARNMLKDALDAGASMKDIETEARKHLGGCTPAHVDEQIERMRDLQNYLGAGE
jgi:hypothetical protein